MKKTFILLLIVFLLCGCGKQNEVIENKTLQNTIESKKDDKIDEDSKNVDVQEQNTNKNETDSNKEENVESKDDNNKTDTSKTNTSTNKSNSENKNTNTSKNETSTNYNETKESNVEVKKEETNEKHTCTDADSEYVSWKNNYLKENGSTRFFDSYDEAYNYGDKISLKYFYGFIVQKTPTTYNGNNCNKTLYTMQLYIPQGICESNPMIYLPNSVEIEKNNLDTISYLKQIGYECAGKNL